MSAKDAKAFDAFTEKETSVLDMSDPTLQMSDDAIASFVDTPTRVRLSQRPDIQAFHRLHQDAIHAIEPNTARALYVTLAHARTGEDPLIQALSRPSV